VVLGCVHGHRYDVARQGHVVLVPGGSKLRADTADMVAARARVLGSGAFDDVRDALVRAVVAGTGATGVAGAGPLGGPGVGPGVGPVVGPLGAPAEVAVVGAGEDGLVVDLGAGTGWYAAGVLDALPRHLGIALELSTPALRLAARAHPRLAALGADLTRPLPLADGAVGRGGALTAVFAPLPPPPELARVARPGAALVVVTPTPDHLAGLRLRLGLLDVPAGKPSRLAARHAAAWQVVAQQDVVAPLTVDPAGAADVVAMGPNAWHIDDRLRDALLDLPDRLTDTLSVTVTRLARR
jgi:23S rRNA (guanine745-N1)-methyltransferase